MKFFSAAAYCAFAAFPRSFAGPADNLAKEMTHDLEVNFNKIAPFGKEDTAKELQDHAAKTQDTLVDAVENAEVAEIKRAVFRALTRLRAATIKEFDTIARCVVFAQCFFFFRAPLICGCSPISTNCHPQVGDSSD